MKIKTILMCWVLLAIIGLAVGPGPAQAESRAEEKPPQQQISPKKKDEKGYLQWFRETAEEVHKKTDQSTSPARSLLDDVKDDVKRHVGGTPTEQSAEPYRHTPSEQQKIERDKVMQEHQRMLQENRSRTIEERVRNANKLRGIDKKHGPGDIADEPGVYKSTKQIEKGAFYRDIKNKLREQTDPRPYDGLLTILDAAQIMQTLIDCKRSGKSAPHCAKKIGMNKVIAKSISELLKWRWPAGAPVATFAGLAVADVQAIISIMELQEIRQAMEEDQAKNEKQARSNLESDRITWPGDIRSLRTRLDTLQQQFDGKLSAADKELKAACSQLMSTHGALAGKVAAAQTAIKNLENHGVTQEAVDTACPSNVQSQLEQIQSRINSCESTIASAAIAIKAQRVKCASADETQKKAIEAKITELQNISKTLTASIKSDLAKARKLVKDAKDKVRDIRSKAQNSFNNCDAKFKPKLSAANAAVNDLSKLLDSLKAAASRARAAGNTYAGLKGEYATRLKNFSLSVRRQLENSVNDELVKEANAMLDGADMHISSKQPALPCKGTLNAAVTDLKVHGGDPKNLKARIEAVASPCRAAAVNCPAYAVPGDMQAQYAQAQLDLSDIQSVDPVCDSADKSAGQTQSGDQKTGAKDKDKGKGKVDCSQYPGSVAAWSDKHQRWGCSCPKGKAWNDSRTTCVAEGGLTKPDCAQYPGSVAAWSDKEQRWGCVCSKGSEWNDSRTACQADKQSQRADVDCSSYPGSVPQWSDNQGRWGCACPKGTGWNDSKTACQADKQSQRADVDCSSYPGSVARWSDSRQRWGCACPKGSGWNDSRTACVAKRQTQRADVDCSSYPGSAPAWDANQQRWGCACPKGMQWNEGRTACVAQAQAKDTRCDELNARLKSAFNRDALNDATKSLYYQIKGLPGCDIYPDTHAAMKAWGERFAKRLGDAFDRKGSIGGSPSVNQFNRRSNPDTRNTGSSRR